MGETEKEMGVCVCVEGAMKRGKAHYKDKTTNEKIEWNVGRRWCRWWMVWVVGQRFIMQKISLHNGH